MSKRKTSAVLGFLGYPGHGVKTTLAALSAIGIGPQTPTPYSRLRRESGSAPKRHLYTWRQGRKLRYDRWPSTMGVSPNACWLEVESATHQWGAVYLPGYPWTVGTRIAHFGVLDGIILTVAPSQFGPEVSVELQRQMLVARHMGVTSVVVFLSKQDQTSRNAITTTREAMEGMLLQCGYDEDNVAFVHGSAKAAVSQSGPMRATIQSLRDTIERTIIPRKTLPGPFKLCVTRAYRIAGLGQVLTGRVARGHIETGGSVSIIRQRGVALLTNVEELRVFGRVRTSGYCGELLGLLVKTDNDRDRERRGTVVSQPGSAILVQHFLGEVHWGPTETKSRSTFSGWLEAQIFVDAAVAGVRIFVSGGRPQPGDLSTAHFEIVGTIAAEVGSRFSLHWQHTVIGLGTITQLG